MNKIIEKNPKKNPKKSKKKGYINIFFKNPKKGMKIYVKVKKELKDKEK